VAINQDSVQAAVTANNIFSATSGLVEFLNFANLSGVTSTITVIDQDPTAVAIDPGLNMAAVTTASQFSGLDLVNIGTASIAGRISGLQIPTGVIFDPVNQVFLAANSLANTAIIVDPNTFIQTPIPVGINPTSLDYNFQASTLVTVNSASNTMSVIDYVCPPTSGAPAGCAGPRVRAILGITGSELNSQLQEFSVAIDPKLNLAVLVDQNNDRILLVPLPY
jgi:DNA-binding beta-propeller fold protein YncE